MPDWLARSKSALPDQNRGSPGFFSFGSGQVIVISVAPHSNQLGPDHAGATGDLRLVKVIVTLSPASVQKRARRGNTYARRRATSAYACRGLSASGFALPWRAAMEKSLEPHYLSR